MNYISSDNNFFSFGWSSIYITHVWGQSAAATCFDATHIWHFNRGFGPPEGNPNTGWPSGSAPLRINEGHMGPLDNPGGVEWPLRGFSKNSTTFRGSQHCSGLDLWAQGKARTDYLGTETTRSTAGGRRGWNKQRVQVDTRARAHAPIHTCAQAHSVWRKAQLPRIAWANTSSDSVLLYKLMPSIALSISPLCMCRAVCYGKNYDPIIQMAPTQFVSY